MKNKTFIGFNKPFLAGNELTYIQQAVSEKHISGNGKFTKLCQSFFEKRYGFKKCLLTTSCTDALEMAALLINIQQGDEVIIPSFTFVSTANAFVLRGAKIVFADSQSNNPNISAETIAPLINARTKAIVVVHYAGVACDMDPVMDLANQHKLWVIEDAAQAIDSYYKSRPLGSIGHLAAFSFHETKNIISGEGGMLVINDDRFFDRSEILWEKGTNRSAFFKGEVDKYGWVDVGSSFLPSEIIAAFLYAQLECLESIQAKRKAKWKQYFEKLTPLQEGANVKLPHTPTYASGNAHIFYLVCDSETQRDALIAFLKDLGIHAVFHYQVLHQAEFLGATQNNISLPHAEAFSKKLLRLPLYIELDPTEITFIVNSIRQFFTS